MHDPSYCDELKKLATAGVTSLLEELNAPHKKQQPDEQPHDQLWVYDPKRFETQNFNDSSM